MPLCFGSLAASSHSISCHLNMARTKHKTAGQGKTPKKSGKKKAVTATAPIAQKPQQPQKPQKIVKAQHASEAAEKRPRKGFHFRRDAMGVLVKQDGTPFKKRKFRPGVASKKRIFKLQRQTQNVCATMGVRRALVQAVDRKSTRLNSSH